MEINGLENKRDDVEGYLINEFVMCCCVECVVVLTTEDICLHIKLLSIRRYKFWIKL